MSKAEYAAELLNITKVYDDYVANDNITLQLKYGEIHALLGENGAGKSTLMNILFGLVKPDAGEIKVNGRKVNIKNPNDATAYGIGMVHQHFKQVECFSVLQNIVLGVEDTKFGFLKYGKARKKVKDLSEKYGFDIDLDEKISDITVGMQQRVEILKMLYRDNDILIFDEPTAVLTPQEIDDLLVLMKRLAESGKSILFITHKLKEIKAVADRCSVIRKGKYISTVDVSSVTKEEMSELMMGRKVNLDIDKKEREAGDTVLKVENLSVLSSTKNKNAVDNVSFEIKRGEIVCIAGIDGNGQSELVYAITGLLASSAGKITLCKNDITKASVRERTLAGLAHIPEDRLKYGLVEGASVSENMILQSYYTDLFQKNGFLKFDEVEKYTSEQISQYDIAVPGGTVTNAGGLSGGNQQKLVLARELSRQPDLVIASQPVRGLDIGAIEYIHNKLIEARDDNRAVILVTFDLNEVMNLSDRILVMHKGKIAAELDPKQTTEKELGLYMAGGEKI